MKAFFGLKKKTTDENYKNANTLFKQITTDYTKLSTSLKILLKNLQTLSENVTKLCEDTNGWFVDAPQDKKDQSIQLVSFSRGFDVQVFNRLIPGIEEITLNPFLKFESDIEKIYALKQNRSKARKSYDNSRQNSKIKQEDINQLRENYEKLNQNFIDAVNVLAQQRPKRLEAAYNDFITHYMTFINNTFVSISSLADGIGEEQKNMFVKKETTKEEEKLF